MDLWVVVAVPVGCRPELWQLLPKDTRQRLVAVVQPAVPEAVVPVALIPYLVQLQARAAVMEEEMAQLVQMVVPEVEVVTLVLVVQVRRVKEIVVERPLALLVELVVVVPALLDKTQGAVM